jgi:hypothetical protein
VKIFIQFLILFILSISIQATNINKLEDTQLRVELATSLFKANERIARKYNIGEDLSNPSADFIETVAKELRGETKKILHASLEVLSGPTVKKSHIQKFLDRVKWQKMSRTFISKLNVLRTYIRKQGFFYVGYALFTNVLQFTIPAMLVAAEMNVLGVIAFYFLGDLPAYLYYKIGHSIYYRHKMFRLFGGKKKYLEFKKIDKEVKKNLRLSGTSDLLLPLESERGKTTAIVLKEDSLIKKLMRRVGHRDKGLNLSELRRFVKKKNIRNNSLQILLDNDELPEMMKLAMATLEISRSTDASTQLAFKEQFSEYFVSVKDTSSMEEIYKWVQEMLETDDLDSLKKKALNLPESIKTSEQFVILWQEIILPRIAEKKDMMTFNQYRKLTGTFQLFKVNIYKNELELDSPIFFDKFDKYLSSSFGKTKVNCAEKIDTFIGKVVKKYKK